jgi:ribonuclease-3
VTANRRTEAVAALEQALGHSFADPSLLERALTHASVGDGMGKVAHYERLEFLGDRVLGLLAADALMASQPEWREGQLTRRHAMLVNGSACARVARRLEVGPALRLAGGTSSSGGRDNDTILGDAMEAIMAAVYLDAGLDAARALFAAAWVDELARPDEDAEREPKTNLQEWAMAKALPLPRYTVVERTGPAHEPKFTVEVIVEGYAPARGQAGSRQAAEKAAARLLLQREGALS